MVYCTIMYITKYGCVFLKLGESTIDNRDYVVSIIYESTYVAMDLIPILLGFAYVHRLLRMRGATRKLA